MQAPELAVQELKRCIQDLGLAGVQIGTHINGMNLDHPSLFPIFEVRNNSPSFSPLPSVILFVPVLTLSPPS